MNLGSILTQAADPGQGAGQSAFQLVLALGGSAALAALISGFFARRKTGADAASVLSSASMAQVQSYRTEVTELKAERDADEAKHAAAAAKHEAAAVKHQADMTELRERVAAVEVRADQAEARETALITWARQVVALLRDRAIAYPPPPPGVSDSGGHRTVAPKDF